MTLVLTAVGGVRPFPIHQINAQGLCYSGSKKKADFFLLNVRYTSKQVELQHVAAFNAIS